MIFSMFPQMKLIALGIGVLSLLGAFFWYGHREYVRGKETERAACFEAQRKAIDNAAKIRQSNSNISRPSDDDYIKRLRDGKL